ncbi:hypothetical protein TNCV_1845421 [Trichonephila clavipes]|nr:hypothetical protein TNCV_1845421 [Trichonephila clavipes]
MYRDREPIMGIEKDPSNSKSSLEAGGRGRKVGGPQLPPGGSPTKLCWNEPKDTVTSMVLKATDNDRPATSLFALMNFVGLNLTPSGSVVANMSEINVGEGGNRTTSFQAITHPRQLNPRHPAASRPLDEPSKQRRMAGFDEIRSASVNGETYNCSTFKALGSPIRYNVSDANCYGVGLGFESRRRHGCL